MTTRPVLLLCALAGLGATGCRRAERPAPAAVSPQPAPDAAPAASAPDAAPPGAAAAPEPALAAPAPAAAPGEPRAEAAAPEPLAPAAKPAAAPPAKGLAGDPDEGVVYRWEDADGVHYGHLFEVPAALRKRARPVDAEVGSVSVEPAAPPAAAASAAGSGAAGPAAAPAERAAKPAEAAPDKGPEKSHYQRAVDLATGRPSADRPPDPKCRRENGMLVCDP
ncbi:hypothetical protein [Anaeromyxobacter paludicola]|uniref:DUF4124 domain-containing protein n=1 Tax=Anaeromyxobacter paludicola TaxID=2918171 RepID=A0ABM7XDM7_9BACT|nr:hypothetical protein [Anaeromyxobacter paludicola]BDG09969.1 hypothetical protein AMPC_30820 [Anaeromyxobacter paludicola]